MIFASSARTRLFFFIQSCDELTIVNMIQLRWIIDTSAEHAKLSINFVVALTQAHYVGLEDWSKKKNSW
jgi:hypothetical protein